MRPTDFKRLNLSPSDQRMFKRWSRTVAAIYASLALAGVVVAIATSTPRSNDVTAQGTPASVIAHRN